MLLTSEIADRVEEMPQVQSGEGEGDLLHWLVGRDAEPLPTVWSFWMDSWELSRGRASMVKLVCLETHDTATGFWGCFQQYGPAALPACASLHIFKKGIQPAYDDPLNRSGGHFKMVATSPEAAELIWFTVTRALVKEAIPQFEGVNGCTLLSKQRSTIGVKLWIQNSLDKEHVEALRGFLSEVLDRGLYTNVKFCPHKYILQTLLNQRKANLAQEKQSAPQIRQVAGVAGISETPEPTLSPMSMPMPMPAMPTMPLLNVLAGSGVNPAFSMAPLPLPASAVTTNLLYQMQSALAAQQVALVLSQMYPGIPLPHLLMAYAAAEQAVLSQSCLSPIPPVAPMPAMTSPLCFDPAQKAALATMLSQQTLPALALQRLQSLAAQPPPMGPTPPVSASQHTALSPNPLGLSPFASPFVAQPPAAPSVLAPLKAGPPGATQRPQGRARRPTELPPAVPAPAESQPRGFPTLQAGASARLPSARTFNSPASILAARDGASCSVETGSLNTGIDDVNTMQTLTAELMRLFGKTTSG